MSGDLETYAELSQVLADLPVILREGRRARRLSQRAAAAQIGCSFSTISRAEQGDDGMALSTAKAILRWLDRPVIEPEAVE
jgi:transcriptional regulator with XRE-family HTH domain